MGHEPDWNALTTIQGQRNILTARPQRAAIPSWTQDHGYFSHRAENRELIMRKSSCRRRLVLESLESRTFLSATLYAATSDGQLCTLDTSNGIAQIIGSTGVTLFDIAVDPQGRLFGVDIQSNLYRIDPATAAITQIGALGTFVNSLAFSPAGVLYGANTSLYTIDTSTGAATLVGNLGGYNSAGDLAFDNQGRLFLTDDANELVNVNPLTGVGKLVGGIGVSQIFGLAYGADGVMYGLSNSSNEIVSINLSTGLGTLATTYSGINGIYGADAVPPVIPAPPNNLKATQGRLANYVEITWDTDVNTAHYDIWRNTHNTFASVKKIAANIGATIFDDITASPQTHYYYWVTAANVAGISNPSVSALGYAKKGTPLKLVIQTLLPTNTNQILISSDAQMPTIVAEAQLMAGPGDILTNVPVSWKVDIKFDATKYSHGRSSDSTSFHGVQSTIGPDVVLDFSGQVRGGNLTIAGSVSVQGKTFTASTKGLMITATPPTQQQVIDYINSAVIPSLYPVNSDYDYHTVLRRIASLESSGFQQFQSPNSPLFNRQGDGGVGIMQVTPGKGDFHPADVWDWKANVDDGIQTFVDKLNRATDFTVHPDVSLPGITNEMTKTRTKLKLVLVQLPVFTPNQFVREAVHFYNGGVAYKPTLKSDGTLVVSVNSATGVGTVALHDIGGYDTQILGSEIP